MKSSFRAVLSVLVIVTVSLFAPALAGADPSTPSARCTERFVDAAGALDKSRIHDLTSRIDDVAARAGADIYIRVIPSAPYEYSVIAEANMFNSSSARWWDATLEECPNWTKERDGIRSEADNLFAVFLGADDGYVSVGHGSRFSSREVNEAVYTAIKPALTENGVEAAVEATLGSFQVPDEGSPFVALKWVAIGLAVLGFLALATWVNMRGSKPEQHPVARPSPAHYADEPDPEVVSADWAREALTQLDDEWLKYEMDTEAYCLTKPILRDHTDPIVLKYHDTLYSLREAVSRLNGAPGTVDAARANALADSALSAWDAANHHALNVGVSTLSPVERAALRRLHGMVSQLTNNATPRAMVSTIIARMKDEIEKLDRTPVPWSSVESLPAIHDRAELLALVQGAP